MSFDTYRVVDFSPVKGLGFVGQREDGDTARVSIELGYNQLVFTLEMFDGSRDKMYEAIGKFLSLLMQMGMIATVEEDERDIVIIKYEHNDALSMNAGMGVDQPVWCTFEEIEWLESRRDDKCEEMTAKVNCRYDEEDDDCFCEYCSEYYDSCEDCHSCEDNHSGAGELKMFGKFSEEETAKVDNKERISALEEKVKELEEEVFSEVEF